MARRPGPIILTFAVVVAVFLLAPLITVVILSFSQGSFMQFPPTTLSLRWYVDFFTSVRWLTGLWSSFIVGLGSTAIALLSGAGMAYSVWQAPERERWILPVAMLPAVLPVILIAVGLFLEFVQVGLVYTRFGMMLAHSVIALPFVVLTLRAGFSTISRELMLAGLSLGASELRVILKVILPALGPFLMVAATLAFATSFDEVVIALLLSGGEGATLPKLMFVDLRDQIEPVIAAISTVLMAVSILVILLARLVASMPERIGTDKDTATNA